MEKHRIAYIDERKEDLEIFQRKFSPDFEVETFFPKSDLANFVEILLKANFDAIVTDHKLAEYREEGCEVATYDGVELVKELQRYRKDFPCFILTSYDDDAIAEADDVNSVYPKGYIEGGDNQHGKTSLQERIRRQIEHYLAKVENAKKRFQELLEKHEKDKLSIDEENELLMLDSYLESNICHWRSIPKEKKDSIAINKVVELLDTTRDLLGELKKEN
jgi:CheY-like chemotaxis protein